MIKDPNGWAEKNVIDEINFKTSLTARKLRDMFAMSPSQKAITDRIFKKRLQIVWGPPVSRMREKVALDLNDTVGFWQNRIFGSFYQLVHQVL